MKKLRIILTIILVFVLGSCVKEAKLKISTKKKLVVYCLLNPDDSITKIFVDYNRPVGEKITYNMNNGDNMYNNAEIELSDGNQSITVRYNVSEKMYMFRDRDFDIKPGLKYTLKVRDLANGTQVQATTQVPVDLVRNSDFTIDSVLNTGDDHGVSYYISISWDDIVGQRNFYAYDFVDSSYNSGESMFATNFSYIVTDEKVVNGRIDAEPQLLLNSLLTPQELKRKIEDGRISTRVYNLDKPLYDYLVYAGMSEGEDEETIFQDPVTVYTNIEGGLGVFGAYRETKRIIDKLK